MLSSKSRLGGLLSQIGSRSTYLFTTHSLIALFTQGCWGFLTLLCYVHVNVLPLPVKHELVSLSIGIKSRC